MKTHAPQWTIEELVQRAERALEVDYYGQVSRRVSDVPTLRNIRYYTTLGLLDRPAEIRGRTAYYSLRHLMQLVAIKRLQAEGLSLTEIQNRLLGLSDAKLGRIAKLPEDRLEFVSEPTPTRPQAARQQARFWTFAPSEAPAPEVREATVGSQVEMWQSIPLDAGVRLMIEGATPLDAATVREIQNAARPLLRALQSRRRS
jgi:DNA-binding transcriptional MerR regulator